MAIALITVGTVPEAKLAEAQDYALAVAAKPALGKVGFTLVAIAALLANTLTAASNSTLAFDSALA